MLKSTLRMIATYAMSISLLGSFGGWREQEAWGVVLSSALAPTGSAARLYFAGPCTTTQGAFDQLVYPEFPRLISATSRVLESSPQTVEEVLQDQTGAVVRVDQSGMTRITVGTVPRDLLSTKIRKISFWPMAQWNPSEAIRAIERTNEVSQSMRALNITPTIGTVRIEMILTGPGPDDSKLPHLPAILKNVTMDEALDGVARTFKQLVTYGVCTQANGQKVYHIDYTSLVACGSERYYYDCFNNPQNVLGPTELSPLPSSSPQGAF